METFHYIGRKILLGIPLLFGVTLISFTLMVYFGPDQTYSLIGKSATQADIDNIRHQLGYDLPFYQRYLKYLYEIATFDFGYSSSTNEAVNDIFSRTIPISIMVALPGFILGNLLGVLLGLFAAFYRGAWPDKLVMFFSVIGMSISFLIVIIGFQLVFCSSFGLDLFPVQGWYTGSFFQYLEYVTVPTMATVFVSLGYNTRFYRAVLVEEIQRDHVRTARAYGCPPFELMIKHVLVNSLVPIITRIIFTVPFVLIGGSLLIESFFGIPGIGGVTYDAITSGDLPVLKAVVSTATIIYVGVLVLTDILYKLVDPRISLT